MGHAIERAWRPGRALALIAGLLLAGGVLIQATPAQPPKKPADKPNETKPVAPRQKVIHLPSDIGTDLITASGKNSDNGAVNFILAHVSETVPPGRRGEDGMFEMVPITSRVTRLFLGIQTQCTQCHDHPFDAQLKQKHFWGV